MRFIEKNENGESIMYEFIDSSKIRLTCNKIKRHISYQDDELVLYDFDGGPKITKGSTLIINNIEYLIHSIKIIKSQSEDMVELMLYI
jgi:hypothetical protein